MPSMSRRLMLIATAIALLCAAPTRAQTPPPPFSEQEAAAIKAVVAGYFDSFTRKDWARFATSFQTPFVIVGLGPSLIPTVDDIVRGFQMVHDRLDTMDYVASKPVDVRVTPLGPQRALAAIHWQRFKKDGSVLNEGAEIFVFSKGSGTWKMCGNLGQELAQFGKVF